MYVTIYNKYCVNLLCAVLPERNPVITMPTDGRTSPEMCFLVKVHYLHMINNNEIKTFLQSIVIGVGVEHHEPHPSPYTKLLRSYVNLGPF